MHDCAQQNVLLDDVRVEAEASPVEADVEVTCARSEVTQDTFTLRGIALVSYVLNSCSLYLKR